jgi:adenosine deaminase
VSGIDFAGNPNKNSFKDFENVFKYARNEGIKITCNLGEEGNLEESIKILDFGPERIGVNNLLCKELESLLIKKKIPSEICLSTNLTKQKLSESKKQFKNLYDIHHPILLSTVDRGIFDTSLTKEYHQLINEFNLSGDDLKKFLINGVDFCFASDTIKNKLKSDILGFELKE